MNSTKLITVNVYEALDGSIGDGFRYLRVEALQPPPKPGLYTNTTHLETESQTGQAPATAATKPTFKKAGRFCCHHQTSTPPSPAKKVKNTTPKVNDDQVLTPSRRGTTKPNKEAESKREKASTRINLQGSHERREQDDVARQAAYQPAMDNWSHRLSNQTSLNINPEPYPPVNRTSRLAFGSTTHETHLTTEREELEHSDTEEIQEPAAVEEIQDPYPPAIL
ncbi:hypothetical protein F2Q68_00027756 [Brassica cretica]|uniref:Uncharacterized protein n=1 Tax=Brassica cretica TaxID=69181 RepID=A0A8S9ICH6_BRACR|nr:hypothetical protein F2Q68_00027756 [Brassica cretica]